MLNELLLFLAKHKTEASEKATHTGMYVPLVWAWTLYGEDLDTFWRMYTTVYSSCLRGGKRLGIGLTEVQQDVCPLLIDIDIKTNKKFGCSRIYTQADIVTLVELYRTVAAQFVVIENNEAHVFEKPSPRKKDTHVKDGFHVMFNHIVIPKRVHKRIHQLVKERVDASRDMAHLVGIQTVNALIDDAITSNNWMLYGSVKKED